MTAADAPRQELTACERRWLEYARAVVTDGEHITACRALGGSPDGPGVDDPLLRWPGFIGHRYRPGGVLCIANVHRDFGSAGLPAAVVERLVDATRAFRDGGDPVAYLDAARAAYSVGLRTWTVGRHFRRALALLGLDIDECAYSNAARCQIPELDGIDRGGLKIAVQKLCLRRFPIHDLVDLLEPRAVLCSSRTAYDTMADVDVPVVYFNQRNGTLAAPVRARPDIPVRSTVGVWAAALAEGVET